MKAKKLPDVWVMLNDTKTLSEVSLVRTDLHPSITTETVHRYTPAKPPKVCVWYQDGEDSFWIPGCVGLGGAWDFNSDGPKENRCTYCMRCGGKIEVKR